MKLEMEFGPSYAVVQHNGREARLSRTETAVLKVIQEASPRAVTRNGICQSVWGCVDISLLAGVPVYCRNINKKLPHLITSVTGYSAYHLTSDEGLTPDFDFGAFKIIADRGYAVLHGERIEFSPAEMRVLVALAQEAPNLIAIDKLCYACSGGIPIASAENTRSVLYYLRRKLGSHLILNKPHVGYWLEVCA